MPNHFLDAIAAVPKEIWSALTGATVAILGSAFTTWRNNAHARGMLEKQLTAAATQAEEKRTLDLKREVVIPAVTGATRAFTVIGALGNLDVPDSDILADIATAGREINGIHVVGSEHTLQETLKFTTKLAEMTLAVTIKRAQAAEQKSRVDFAWQTVAGENSNGAAIVEQMKSYNLHGASEEQWQRLNKQHETHLQLLVRWTEDAKSKDREFKEAVIQLMDAQMFALEQLSPLQVNVLVAIRQDLLLPLDAALYERLVAESFQRLLAGQQELKAHLQSL